MASLHRVLPLFFLILAAETKCSCQTGSEGEYQLFCSNEVTGISDASIRRCEQNPSGKFTLILRNIRKWDICSLIVHKLANKLDQIFVKDDVSARALCPCFLCTRVFPVRLYGCPLMDCSDPPTAYTDHYRREAPTAPSAPSDPLRCFCPPDTSSSIYQILTGIFATLWLVTVTMLVATCLYFHRLWDRRCSEYRQWILNIGRRFQEADRTLRSMAPVFNLGDRWAHLMPETIAEVVDKWLKGDPAPEKPRNIRSKMENAIEEEPLTPETETEGEKALEEKKTDTQEKDEPEGSGEQVKVHIFKKRISTAKSTSPAADPESTDDEQELETGLMSPG